MFLTARSLKKSVLKHMEKATNIRYQNQIQIFPEKDYFLLIYISIYQIYTPVSQAWSICSPLVLQSFVHKTGVLSPWNVHVGTFQGNPRHGFASGMTPSSNTTCWLTDVWNKPGHFKLQQITKTSPTTYLRGMACSNLKACSPFCVLHTEGMSSPN